MKHSLPILQINDKDRISALIKQIEEFQNTKADKPSNHQEMPVALGLTGNAYWENIRSETLHILRSKHFVIVQNLPFDFDNDLFIAFASFIGNPVVTYTDKKERIVRDVSPVKGKVLDPSLAHTDSTFWPSPNEMTALQCVNRDSDGNGRSRIVKIAELLERLPDSRTLVEKFRDSKFPFVLDPRFGDGGYQMLPILIQELENNKIDYQVRFNLSDTLSCLQRFNISLPEEDLRDLALFEKTATSIAEEQEFLLENGDLLLFDNLRTLHSRSRCEAGSDRLVRMMKLNY